MGRSALELHAEPVAAPVPEGPAEAEREPVPHDDPSVARPETEPYEPAHDEPPPVVRPPGRRFLGFGFRPRRS